jgi:hypothetical protein
VLEPQLTCTQGRKKQMRTIRARAIVVRRFSMAQLPCDV